MPLLPTRSRTQEIVVRRDGNTEVLARRPTNGTGLLRSALARMISGSAKSVPGQNAGFGGIGVGSLTRRITSFIETYGGDTPITWIYACVKLIQEEVSQYPYVFVDPTTAADLAKCSPIPYRNVPIDLAQLLKQPNQFMNYSDMLSWLSMDLELVGNSYWLKDQTNGLGQPLALQRLRPEFARIAVDRSGVVLGYTYSVQGVQVAYNLDQVIHYKLPNPHSEYYGMGTVQGVLQDAGIQINIDEHVIGFFASGAKISGVLTIAGTLPAESFQRIKQQFREEYAGGGNEFSILVAEQGMRFDPVVSSMADAGVKELKEVSKDAILSGFGVHQEMLGGSNNSGDARMDDAWRILSRKMAPKARRISEKQTYALVALWGNLGLWLTSTEVEGQDVKVARARDMLGAGATVNDARTVMGLPPVEPRNFPHLSPEQIDMANTPILPSGYDPFWVVQQAPGATKPDGDGNGRVPFDEVLPGGSHGNADGNVTPTTPADDASRIRQIESPSGKPVFLLPSGKALPAPTGFEQVGDLEFTEAALSDAEAIIAIQARIYEDEVLAWELDQIGFFNEQRNRVLREVLKFVTSRDAKRLGKQPKKNLTVDRVWNALIENQLARTMYVDRALLVAQRTVNEIAALFMSAPAEVRGLVERVSMRMDSVNKVTRDRIDSQLLVGVTRSYSPSQIANGVPNENYLGIAGVFDSAVETRAPTIARSELAVVYNISSLASYHQIGVQRVEVIDGEADEACAEARGQVWTLDKALVNPIAHPRCMRSFAPIFAGTGRPDPGA
jgi:HK97 family phage portal protein